MRKNLIVCDACGCENKPGTRRVRRDSKSPAGKTGTAVDLCPRCMVRLIRWYAGEFGDARLSFVGDFLAFAEKKGEAAKT